MMDIKSLFKNIDLFNSLQEEELDEVIKISLVKTLNKDNILFYEGDKADKFYFLLDGHLKLYKTGIKSQEIVLHYFTQPTMVAEMATLENINFPATAVIVKDETRVALIEKENFLDILKKDSQLSFHIIKSLTKKIKNLEVSIKRNLVFDATTKVCSLLKENPEILILYKKNEVAHMLNIAPETLSRTLLKLKKLEIINDEYNVIDTKKLDTFLEF